MYSNLKNVLTTRHLFEDSNNKYWDDPYISKNLLALHLEQYGDNASRNFKFLDESFVFINKLMLKNNLKSVIDFGCGPGLYCAKFAKENYK
ncbi:MAG TPA: hypothetical protein VFC75_02170, partial [Erysipelothrix sp.]|nr:hypothetical protein [Erysipelothrix sp.]